MGFLLYNKQSGITARALANILGLNYNSNEESLIKRGFHPTIRYGNSKGEFEIDTETNSPNVIKICADSLKFTEWGLENEIFTPIYKPISDFESLPEFPFLVRKRWHRAGKDIVIINDKEDMSKLYRILGARLFRRYCVPFYKTKYEIRVHYVMGEIPRIFVKQPTENADVKNPIRTSPNGWHYSLRTNLDESYKKAQALVHRIAKILNLSFGGFDMAWSSKYERYIVWEINTAPGLNQETLQVYADILRPHV